MTFKFQVSRDNCKLSCSIKDELTKYPIGLLQKLIHLKEGDNIQIEMYGDADNKSRDRLMLYRIDHYNPKEVYGIYTILKEFGNPIYIIGGYPDYALREFETAFDLPESTKVISPSGQIYEPWRKGSSYVVAKLLTDFEEKFPNLKPVSYDEDSGIFIFSRQDPHLTIIVNGAYSINGAENKIIQFINPTSNPRIFDIDPTYVTRLNNALNIYYIRSVNES